MDLVFENKYENKPNFAGFDVICIGLPGTGEASMKCALSWLLQGACYDITSVATGSAVDLLHWNKFLESHSTQDFPKMNLTKSVKRTWINFLEGRGFRSGVGFPIALFYKELLEIFPNCKVILTIAKDPGDWFNAVKSSFYSPEDLYSVKKNGIHKTSDDIELSEAIKRSFNIQTSHECSENGFLHVISQGKEASIEFYNNWNNQVISSVPEDRIIIIEKTKMNWDVICRFLNLPIPPESIRFPNFDDIIGTKQLMTVDLPSSPTGSSSSSKSSCEEEENFESNFNEIEEPNDLEEVQSLPNGQFEDTFESTSNGFNPQNESTPLHQNQEEVSLEELVESTEYPDTVTEKHVEKMEFWSMELSGNSKDANETSRDDENGSCDEIGDESASCPGNDKYEPDADSPETKASEKKEFELQNIDNESVMDVITVENGHSSEGSIDELGEEIAENLGTTSTNNLHNSQLDTSNALIMNEDTSQTGDLKDDNLTEIAHEENGTSPGEDIKVEKEIIVINRVQREIRIEEEIFPEEEIIPSQTIIETKLVSSEDEQTIPVSSGIDDQSSNNAGQNCFETQSCNSDDKALDQNLTLISQKDNDVQMTTDGSKDLPRLPVIEGVEIVEEIVEEERGQESRGRASEEETILSPTAYKKKSLLDAPENSRRRSRSRKRSRSRHNVVYHFGMA